MEVNSFQILLANGATCRANLGHVKKFSVYVLNNRIYISAV